MSTVTMILVVFLSLASIPGDCGADPIPRQSLTKRSLQHNLHSASLIASNGKKDQSSSKLRLRFASHEEDNSIHTNKINDTDEDYDFVLNLNEHEEYDRLLNMLGRSGPAKQENKHKPRKSSTFLDRHDELAQTKPEALLASYKGTGFPAKARKTTQADEGSRFDDLQKQKEEEEQKRLEALYFEEIHDQRKSQDVEEEKPKQPKSSANSAALSSLSLLVILLSALSHF